jgi:hypothetical protein
MDRHSYYSVRWHIFSANFPFHSSCHFHSSIFNLSFARDFDSDDASPLAFNVGLTEMRIATIFQRNCGGSEQLLGDRRHVLSDAELSTAIIF